MKKSVLLLTSGTAAVVVAALLFAWAYPASQSTEAVGTGPEMSLNVEGGDCDHPDKPTKCDVPGGSQFTLSVAVNGFPAGGYVGVQSQVVYSPLKYKPTAVEDDEIVWPDSDLPVRYPASPSGQEGIVEHGALTSAGPTFPVSTYVGNVVEITLNCPTSGSYKMALPALAPTNLYGAGFLDPAGAWVPPKTVGQQEIDLDGDTTPELVPVADTVDINCVPPTPTPTPPPPEMSLNVKGGDCDHPDKPTKCNILEGSQFTLSVAVNGFPAGGYVGVQTQVVYSPLKYKPTASVDDEIVWPDAHIPVRSPAAPSGQEGIVEHGALTSGGPTFPVSTYTGNVVEIALNCPPSGSYKMALPVYMPTNVIGTAFLDSTGAQVLPRTVGQQLVPEIDPDNPIPVADTLDINCVPPTATPTPTDTPTPTATPTKNPTGDTDGDGCTDVRENGPDERLGGRRNYTNPWDFYDVNGDKVVTVFGDILAVAGAFGSAPAPPYVEAYDRSPPPAPGSDPGDPNSNEPWDLGPPDGNINVFDDILAVAGQFGHDCR